jgi:hypothetical protein
MLFTWFRERVRRAFLAGVADAVTELDQGTIPTDDAVTTLRHRLGPPPAALPALPGPVAGNGEHGHLGDGQAGPAAGAANGRRGRR